MSPTVLAEVRSALYPNAPALKALASDDAPFRVQAKTCPPVKDDAWGAFPCGGRLRNVCRMALTNGGRLRRFDITRQALNRYVCSLAKPDVRKLSIMFMLRSDGGEDGPRR